MSLNLYARPFILIVISTCAAQYRLVVHMAYASAIEFNRSIHRSDIGPEPPLIVEKTGNYLLVGF